MAEDADINELYGPRRGTENWRFPWLPASWTRAPITWDHLVDNVCNERLEDLSQPLRQHVARYKLQTGRYDRHGTTWYAVDPPTPHEASYGGRAPPYPMRRILEQVPASLTRALSEGTTRFDEADIDSWGDLGPLDRAIVQADDGTWYRSHDARLALQHHIPTRRYVSAHLSREQSHQLIEAWYLVTVERTNDPVLHSVACSFSTATAERGYVRWMGKYVQAAKHIGNGDTFRRFNRLTQYDPARLPSSVLNRLRQRDGMLRNRGSKGTRSKYIKKNRYVPKRRLTRTIDDEERMMPHTISA